MNDSFEDQGANNQASAYMNLSNSEKGELIFKDVKNSYTFWSIKKAIKEEIVKGKGKPNEISEAIPRLMKELNLETKVKNKVHELLDKNGYFKEASKVTLTKFKHCKNSTQLPEHFFDEEYEPLEAIQQAKKQWSELLKQRLSTFIRQTRKPFYRPKKEKIKTKVPQKKEELEPEKPDVEDDGQSTSSQLPTPLIEKEKKKEDSNMNIIGNGLIGLNVETNAIYDWKLLYDHILKVNSFNYASNSALSWGQIKLQIQTRSLEELRNKFIELNVQLRQIGMDEEKSFVDERILMGERLLQKDYQPFLVQYAKRGIPGNLRQKIYKKILYAEINQKEQDYFATQFDQACKWESALDDLISCDIVDISNDDKYFIFQDQLECCVHFFYRDRQLFDMLKFKPHIPIVGIGSNDKPCGVFPHCGVLPVQHFSFLIAPFCYISDQRDEIYFTFRALYAKYLCQLSTISSDPQCIIGLCKLFEDLLQMYEPEVCFHMNQLGISPLKTAFHWIMFAFCGTLEVDQLFLLFDRILGFESLEILPIMAAGIFVFRANLILNCQSQEEFDELFVDMSQIKVMPIIQHFLFATGIN